MCIRDSYNYNLDGSVLTTSLPTSGANTLTLNYQQGSAGRPLSMNETGFSYNLLDKAKYTPAGQLCNLLGTFAGLWTSTASFNSRLQPATYYAVDIASNAPPPVPVPPPPCAASGLIAGTGTGWVLNALVLNYSYLDPKGHNNGDVMSITNVLDTTRSQSFTYDSLNRLATAQTASTHATSAANCWAETYGYDAWGNLTSLGPNTVTQSAYIGCLQESGLSTTATAQNRLAFLSYDSAGNVISNPGVGSYTYDAENHLASTAGVNYTYDGDGKRVMKSNGTIYWYGTNSDPLEETDLSGNFQTAYIYFNGKRAARYLAAGGEQDFYFTDALGSSRTVFSLAGWNISDFYPFGGERVISAGTPNHYKFTGKERDSESGLDNFGARYDSSQFGRFMTPDPVLSTPVHIINPQRWNKYAVALNNPISYVDPDGRDAIAVNFSKEIPLAGHEGIISVHSNGSATYARFGPEHANMPVDIGKATETPLDTKVTFGRNGLPTPDSYAALTKEVATKENPSQDPGSIRMNYFKTSEADTVMLDNWMKAVQGNSGPYICFAVNNCAGFTAAGLLAGHAIDYPTATSLSIFPNEEFWQLSIISNENYTPPPQQEQVTHCFLDQYGNCVQ